MFAAVASALGLAALHLLAGRLRFTDVPRSQYLSVAGGVSVAYVFVHLLPELAELRTALAEAATAVGLPAVAGERLAFLVALTGFVSFYGLERLVVRSRRSTDGEQVARGGGTDASAGAFRLHVGSFTLYNGLIGYLLVHREEGGIASLLLYAVAMGLHFVVNDHGLRVDHREAYDRVGRWVLSAAVLAGLGLGLLADVPEATLGFLLAFLGGGVVLNVIKEELPEERESRFGAFAAGVAGYSVVLLLV